MKYKLLKATHPKSTAAVRGYDPEIWEECEDLYAGGYTIAAKAKKYLPKCVGEDLGGGEDRYKERLGLASFIGYFARQVDAYCSALFKEPIVVRPAADAENPDTPGEYPDAEVYNEFARDADLSGSTFSTVLAQAVTTALKKGRGLVGVDFPRAQGEEFPNLAASDAAGAARPYVFEVLPEELINWRVSTTVTKTADLGPDGKGGTNQVSFSVNRFAWVIIRRVVQTRETPDDLPGDPTEEYRVWQRDPETGAVRWDLYKVVQSKDVKIDDDTDISPEESGETPFKEIPIVEILMPHPLWLGNILGPMCMEHWRRRSALLAAQQRALLVIPTVTLAPEVPGVGMPIPAEAGQNPHRGDDPRRQLEQKGYMVLGQGDAVGFAAPPTAAFDIVDKQLKDLVDEIHRIAGRMAASISSTSIALGRSGESKAQDQNDFRVVLGALSVIAQAAAVRVYDVISAARGDDVRWVASSGGDFVAFGDPTQVTAELALVSGAGPGAPLDLKSHTATVKFWSTRLGALLGLSPEEMAAVREELQQRLAADTTEREAAKAQAAKMAAAQQAMAEDQAKKAGPQPAPGPAPGPPG